MKRNDVTINYIDDFYLIELPMVNDETITKVYYGSKPSIEFVKEHYLGEFKGKEIITKEPNNKNRNYFYYENDIVSGIVAERRVDLEGSFNFRDLGGYKGANNKTVKWGTFFRSDDLFALTQRDISYLEDMGLHTIVDYRSEGEVLSRPNAQIESTTYFNFSPNASTAALASADIKTDEQKVSQLVELANTPGGQAYFKGKMNSMADQMVELASGDYAIAQYRKLIELIKEPLNMPLVQHCRGGKDRTGFGSALILFILGVSEEDVMHDYRLTKDYMAKRNEKRMSEYRQYTDNQLVLDFLYSLMATQDFYMEAALDTMKKMAGSIDNYLIEVMGLTKEEILKMQDEYLESFN